MPSFRRAAQRTSLDVQLPVMAEDAVLVEGDAPLAGEIGLDVRPCGDAVAQPEQARNRLLEGLQALRKCVAQSFHDLEHRQIGVSRSAAGQIGTAMALQQPLEIAQIFRHPLVPELVRALFRGPALILVVQRRTQWMMGVVNFQHQIRYRELKLMQRQPFGLRLGRESKARSQIEQDVGGLPDHELAGLEEWRGERWRAGARFEHPRHRGHAVCAARDIGIVGAGILQCESDIFAAPLNARPVEEFIAHRCPQDAAAWHQFAAKQYSRPSPPVLLRSAWEQPPSGPREGCELFQDFDASSSRNPLRSAWPSIAEPCVLLVQFLQVRSSPAANAVPSGCDPVSMSWRFGLSPMPLMTSPFSVSAVCLVRLLPPCNSATSFAITMPLEFCHGPLPMRSRAFTAGLPSASWVDR